MRHRNWFGTHFGDNIAKVIAYVRSTPADVSWAIVGNIEKTEAGKEHVHSVFLFNRGLTLGGWRKRLGTARGEPRKGSVEQALAYATKEGIQLEIGERPKQGARTDIAAAVQLIADGKRPADVVDGNPGALRYYRALKEYANDRRAPVERDVDVHWYWGPAGVGKSRRAYDENPGAYWVLPPNTPGGPIWFDGYAGESTIVIDDFALSPAQFKRVCDRYPLRVQVKGGSTAALWTKVVVTANYPPEEVYLDHRDWGAIKRRITTLDHMV